jgi:hypothetical protein
MSASTSLTGGIGTQESPLLLLLQVMLLLHFSSAAAIAATAAANAAACTSVSAATAGLVLAAIERLLHVCELLHVLQLFCADVFSAEHLSKVFSKPPKLLLHAVVRDAAVLAVETPCTCCRLPRLEDLMIIRSL